MNQEYWDQFARTGRVEDYLSYREKEVCKAKTEKYGDKCSESVKTMTGMILSVAPIGEYDKRVVILTKEKGKISAFAKGARRPNSPLAGACTPCNFGKFMLYEGRNSNTLQSAEIENYFAELRTDVEAAYYAFYFLEFADFYTREANDEREMLKLLYQTMRVLTKKIIPFVPVFLRFRFADFLFPVGEIILHPSCSCKLIPVFLIHPSVTSSFSYAF